MPLHPVVQNILNRQRSSGSRPLSSLALEEARGNFASARQALGKGPELASVADLTVEGPAGPIPCRLYVPEGTVSGLCVYLHGGGWLLGALDDFDALARALSQRSGCAVLSVDYRLAPEHRFPAALEDANAALAWAAAGSRKLLGGPLPLVIGGDSAGANLATVAALERGKDVDVKLQVLFNPCVDAAFDTPSYVGYGAGYLLTTDDIIWCMSQYAPREQWLTPRISPLRSASLTAAPPSWIGVAEYDPFRDEGEAYANKLRNAGCKVEFRCYRGVMHGYARLFNLVDIADGAVSDAANAMRQAVFA